MKTVSEKIKISNKAIWIGGGIVLLTGGGIALWLLMKKKKAASHPTSSHSLMDKRLKSPCSSKQYPLSLGTCHPDVGILQKHLKALGMDIGSTGNNKDGVDQVFGPKTKTAALKKLGKDTFLASDINGIKNALKFVGK